MSDDDRAQRDDGGDTRTTDRRPPRQAPDRGDAPQRERRRDPDAGPRRPARPRPDDQAPERRVRPQRPDEDGGAEGRPQRDRHEDRHEDRDHEDRHEDRDHEEERRGRRPARLDAIAASERAVDGLQRLTRRPVEGVVAIAPDEDGAFTVTVEVLELERVPSTADVLAEYEVRLDPDGRLLSYRRGDRYARGSTRSE
jgi:hypothetical protein